MNALIRTTILGLLITAPALAQQQEQPPESKSGYAAGSGLSGPEGVTEELALLLGHTNLDRRDAPQVDISLIEISCRQTHGIASRGTAAQARPARVAEL